MQWRSRFLFLCKTSAETLLFFLILHVNLFCCCARNVVLYFLKPKEPSSIVPVALLVGRIRTNFCIRNLQYFTLRIYISSSCRASCRTSHGKLIISVPHSAQQVHRTCSHCLCLLCALVLKWTDGTDLTEK